MSFESFAVKFLVYDTAEGFKGSVYKLSIRHCFCGFSAEIHLGKGQQKKKSLRKSALFYDQS